MHLDILNHCSNAELAELLEDKEKFRSTCAQFYLVKGYDQKDWLDASEAMHLDLMEVVSKRFVDLVCDKIHSNISSAVNAVHDHDYPDNPW